MRTNSVRRRFPTPLTVILAILLPVCGCAQRRTATPGAASRPAPVVSAAPLPQESGAGNAALSSLDAENAWLEAAGSGGTPTAAPGPPGAGGATAATGKEHPAEAAPPASTSPGGPGAAAPGEAAGTSPSMSGAPPGLDEAYLKAVLESQASQSDQARQRISYPEELTGGALVRSGRKPGEVTFYYPLRAVGGVSVEVGKDRAVKLTPPSDASVKPLIDTLTRYLDASREKASWYPTRNMLEITALEENVPFILDLLAFLDAPRKQVIIEAAIWEVSKAQDTQLGSRVDVERRQGSGGFFNMFSNRLDTQAFIDTLTSLQPYQGGTLEFLRAADANHAKMDVVFQFLQSYGYAEIVTRPRMRVSVGETAKIMTGEQVPIQSVKLLAEKLEFGAQTVYRDVGVQLYVTPTIATPDTVTLSIIPSVSEITGYSEPGPGGISNPIIASREAQTLVTVANEELITIGGLDYTKRLTKETKVPFLGDIPVVGLLFKSKRDMSKEVQLWFTVKPTITDAHERLAVPGLTGQPPKPSPE